MGAGNEPTAAAERNTLDESSATEQSERIVTIGERWQARVLTDVARRTSAQRLSHFALERQQRYLPPRAQLLAAAAARVEPPATAGEFVPELRSEGLAALVEPKAGVATPAITTAPPSPREAMRDRITNEIPPLRPAPQSQPRRDPLVAPRPAPTGQPRVATAAAPPAPPPPQPLAPHLTAVEQSQPLRLTGRTQRLLAGVLEMQIPAVKLYVNQAADTVARHYRADAVSVGDKILFRAGKFDPHSPTGLGLLGHELTHAAQARLEETQPTGVAPRGELAQQEMAALGNEARVLHHFAAAPAAAPIAPPVIAPVSQGAPPVVASTAAPALQPRTAATDRAMPPTPAAAAALTDQQLQQIKDVVYRDLMARIRSDFERGG